jgi:hypothetical protein
MTPEKVAPLTVSLMMDEAKDVTGQVFGSRMNEVMLFSFNRPIRTAHTAEGWTPESVVGHAIPAMRPSFYPIDRSSDVFTWYPF